MLVVVSAHDSAKDQKCALASTICLTIANREKIPAREAVDARHRYHVAGREVLEHIEKLSPVAMGARHLLSVDDLGAARAAKLLKLCVDRLPVGRDAGIAEPAVFGVS